MQHVQLAPFPLYRLAAAVTFGAAAAIFATGCAPAAPVASSALDPVPGTQPSPVQSEGVALRVSAELPSSVAQESVFDVTATVYNDGSTPVELGFAVDAISVRASRRVPLDDAPSGRVEWRTVYETALTEVPAIGTNVILAPGEGREFPPLSVPVSLPEGEYTARVCARVRTAPTGPPSEWCTLPVPLQVE